MMDYQDIASSHIDILQSIDELLEGLKTFEPYPHGVDAEKEVLKILLYRTTLKEARALIESYIPKEVLEKGEAQAMAEELAEAYHDAQSY